jgi:glutaredoxin 3
MNLTIYTQPNCIYCDQAKALMKSKGIAYQEIILNVGQVQEDGKMYVPVAHFREKLPNARTMPQILEGKTLIGGFAELQKFLRYD